jgi:putative phosphoribosyl transferase
LRVLSQTVIDAEQIREDEIEAVSAAEQRELERRERAYRDDRPSPQVSNRTVILVDDGLATGSTMQAAVLALRELSPAKIVIAVPTASPDTCEAFHKQVDDVICVITPEPFYAVGMWYRDFSQTTDQTVRDLLSKAEQKLLKHVS